MSKRIPLSEQKPFAHVIVEQKVEQQGPADFVVPVKPTGSKQSKLLNNKAFVMNVKKAWQTGQLSLINYQLEEFPDEVINIETVNLEGEQWWHKSPLVKLDLSNNAILQVPQYNTLIDLQVLRLNNNKIQAIQHELSEQFNNLKSLSLQNNQIVYFDCKLQSAVELNLADNKLTEFTNYCYFPNLELLDISNNQFTAIPLHLPPMLKRLTAHTNNITTVSPQALHECTILEDIYLSKNQIKSLDSGIFVKMQNLKLLDLRENRLQVFTQDIMGLNHQALDQIQLSYNQLQMYTCYQGMPNLTVLLLNNNKLKQLSSEIVQLNGLKTLDLTNNDLSDLPTELGFITSLVRMQLEGNPLRIIRSSLRTAGTEQLKKYLKSRADDQIQIEQKADPKLKSQMYQSNSVWEEYLRNYLHKDELAIKQQGIKEIDKCVFQLRNLISLDLSQNQIQIIPEQLINLIQLKRLVMNENILAELPQCLWQMNQLVEIEAKQNKLTKINPKSIDLENLILLDLSKNQLSYVPDCVRSLPSLKRLHLAYNQISNLDVLLQQNQPMNLEILDISNNRIDVLNNDIYYALPNLQQFNISNNNLKVIPTILGFMNLRSLSIDGNPTKLISRTILDKPADVLLEYLRNKHPQNQIPQRIEQLQENAASIRKSQQSQFSTPQGLPQYEQHNQQFQTSIQSSQQKQSQSYPQQQNNQQQLYSQSPEQYQQYQHSPHQMIVEQQQNQLNAAQRDQILYQLIQLDKEIKLVELQISDNFSMNKFQVQEKRRQHQSLMLQRSQLMQQLN